MQVILTEDVYNLGAMGDIVSVKDGYARNYLVPRGMAMPATRGRVKEMAHKKRMVEDKRRKLISELSKFAEQLNEVVLEVTAKVGEEDRIHGTVTNADIAAKLTQKGYDIDRRKIHIDEPIRTLGEFTVTIRLSSDVQAQIKVNVVEDTTAVEAEA